tara:strand:- start:3131 stop:4075 length:945 start_codon:yes stop_codon:yes gene_type:complete
MTFETTSSVAAVVVVFDPDERFRRLIPLVIGQIQKLWVIDNGSDDLNKNYINSLIAQYKDRINVIQNDQNRGLASAQNQGIREALKSGCGWVLLLDQDSLPEANMVHTMLQAVHEHKADEIVGLITPRHENDNGEASVPTYAEGKWLRFRRYFMKKSDIDDSLAFAMASGSMVPARIFHEIGFMKEEFWIDYIDYNFSFRVKKAGYKILGVGAAGLSHRLGETHQVTVCGKIINYQAHSARRRYTIYRNRVNVIREFGLHFPSFIVFELFSISKDLAKLLLIEQNKIQKLKAIWLGLIHGLIKRQRFDFLDKMR